MKMLISLENNDFFLIIERQKKRSRLFLFYEQMISLHVSVNHVVQCH